VRSCAASVIGLLIVTASAGAQTTAPSSPLAPAVVEGRWLRPAAGNAPAEVWGHADGLRIGLPPLRGPRGLLRVYAPYLKHPPQRVINFIAIEPVRAGQSNRGLSELEHSKLDDVRGKRFWSADTLDDVTPRPSSSPARGVVAQMDGVETLRVYVLSERFDNGAHVYVRLTFRADRPHEVAIATFAHVDSAPLANCVVTATMGNFARVRRLHLAERTVASKEVWPARGSCDRVGDAGRTRSHRRLVLAAYAQALALLRRCRDAVLAVRVARRAPGSARQRSLHVLGKSLADSRRRVVRELRDGRAVPPGRGVRFRR